MPLECGEQSGLWAPFAVLLAGAETRGPWVEWQSRSQRKIEFPRPELETKNLETFYIGWEREREGGGGGREGERERRDKKLDWVAKWCEQWRMRTGPITTKVLTQGRIYLVSCRSLRFGAERKSANQKIKRETVQPMHPKPTWDKYALHYQYLSTEILMSDRATHSPALYKNVNVDIEHIYMWTLHLHTTDFSGAWAANLFNAQLFVDRRLSVPCLVPDLLLSNAPEFSSGDECCLSGHTTPWHCAKNDLWPWPAWAVRSDQLPLHINVHVTSEHNPCACAGKLT